MDPVSVDLATGAAVALPRLAALVSVGSAGAGALLGPVAGPGGLQITVGSFEGGFALDADRRPVLVLAALDAVVGATPYERLDLTDGDALAGAAAQAVTDAATGLLGLLGPLGGAVGVLLGLTDPPGVDHPADRPGRPARRPARRGPGALAGAARRARGHRASRPRQLAGGDRGRHASGVAR